MIDRTAQQSVIDLGPITSLFGDTEGRNVPHNGIDVGVPIGTPVFTEVGGQVERTFYDQLGGTQVIVRTPQGYQEVFAHLSTIASSIGDTIEPGQVIGYSGASGTVTGPHLHYEVRSPSGVAMDPMAFLAEFVPGFASDHPSPARTGAASSSSAATSRPPATDACAAVPADVQAKIKTTLGALVKGGGQGADAAGKLRESYPDVPVACLQQIVYGAAEAVAPKGWEKGLETLLRTVTDPRNLARVAFTAAGVLLIVAGAMMYTGSLRGGEIVAIAKGGEA